MKFIKKETLTKVLSCEFCQIFKNNFFYRILLVPASAVRPQANMMLVYISVMQMRI